MKRLRGACARAFAVACTAASVVSGAAQATTFVLPPPGQRLVGALANDVAAEEDTIVDLARRNRVGYQELALANPAMDHWLPAPGTQVTIPTQFILPRGPREGIVVNLAEYRMYYYVAATKHEPARVVTFALSAGREDWPTPNIRTSISRKLRNPAWYPNRAIRREHADEGTPLPPIVPPGPENPLGPLALKLRMPGGYFIHGTSRPFGIGMPVTHGCLRLYPEDMEELYKMVTEGVKVRIVSDAYKVTYVDDTLYVEAHPPVDDNGVPQVDRAAVEKLLRATLALHKVKARVDPEWLDDFLREPLGIPLAVPLISAATS
jgi:L,D-transpeptidase ErfK/SrfK